MASNNVDFFFFNDTATTEIYTLSLHDALPILAVGGAVLERTEEPEQVAVHPAGDLGVVKRLAPRGLHLLLHVLARLRDYLLYAARVDPAVLHEPLQIGRAHV